MNIGVSGLIVNPNGEILAIQRDDTRTWAPPGGSLELGEMPTNGIVREVEEETGYKVLPVRLVGVRFLPFGKDGFVSLVFRCLVRGGEARVSAESLQVGYISTNPINVPMLDLTRRQLRSVLSHQGGPPVWHTFQLSWRERVLLPVLTYVIYPFKNLRRRLLRQPAYIPPPSWTIGVFVCIRNESGAVLWVQRTDNGRWNLPGGGVESMEPPWEAAIREAKEETGLDVVLTDLTGVYTKPREQEMIFMFSADVIGGELTTGPESADFRYVLSGDEDDTFLPLHIIRVADAIDPDRDITVFKAQTR